MSTDPFFNLTVETTDEAAEIFVIDGQFNRIDSRVGEHAIFKLKRGLYSVKVRTGNQCREQPVALQKDETLSFEQIPYTSPAPIEGTGKTHEFQIDNAVLHSKQIHLNIGFGSQIYVFARNWTEQNRSASNLPLNRDPSTGLMLRDLQNRVLVDFGKPDIGAYSSDWEPWSACNVQLNPGIYLLSLETASGQSFRQTVVASSGWQTQVFLLQRNYGLKDKDVRADLFNGSIFMSELDKGFKSARKADSTSEDVNFPLTEMARQALTNNRQILSAEVINQMLYGKFNNPMLGIYSCHLLLLNQKFDKSQLKIVVNNLRNLLVQPHPDVEAIALKINLPGNYVFNIPPMLRLSWNYVLEASVRKPEIVPERSFASSIAGKLWSADPWLVWGDSKSPMDNNDVLLEQLKKLIQLEENLVNTANLAPDQLASMSKEVDFDVQNTGVQSITKAQREERESFTDDSLISKQNEKITNMVQALGVPRARLEAMIKSIK